jgi:hypothetical protein
MSEKSFSLIPFPASGIPDISITGIVARQNNLITLHYALQGNTEAILLPSVSAHPARKDDLWKSTCFEFFLAIKDEPQYWEFNMSPAGDWNIYCMDAYRRIGFREETRLSQLAFEFKRDTGQYSVDASVDLDPVIRSDAELQVAVAAILQTTRGNESYWALLHPASQPDFHLRESFILALAGRTHPVQQSAPGA